MKFIYYIIIFLSSFLLADIQVVTLITIGGMNVYIIDIIYIILFIALANFVIKKYYSKINTIGKTFLIFLSSIIFFIVVGFFTFGSRAIGEGRYFFWLFAFFLPFSLFPLEKYIDTKEILDTIEKTIYLSAVLAIILFIIEVINGGRVFFSQEYLDVVGFSDFRGVRYLGSEETYNIVILILFLTVKIIVLKKSKLFDTILIIILTSIVIITRNRTAPIALVGALLLFLLLNGKIKQILTFPIIIFGSFLMISLIVPQLMESITIAFSGIFNIREDSTGNWRYMVQLAAIEQGLENPFFGKGFGGYFQYDIPELKQVVELPPHSVFVHLFSKTGIIVVIIAFWAIIKIAINSFKLSRKVKNNEKLCAFYILIFIITISQIPYGFAYSFSIYFGLFAGFFFNLTYRENYSKMGN